VVAHTGLEPVISALRGQRVNQLHQCAACWSLDYREPPVGFASWIKNHSAIAFRAFSAVSIFTFASGRFTAGYLLHAASRLRHRFAVKSRSQTTTRPFADRF
jgi:hypothetical protein